MALTGTAADWLTELRGRLEDTGQVVTDEYVTTDTTTTTIGLTLKPVKTNSETITVNAVTKTRVTDYNVDYDSGVVTFVAALANAATVDVTYTQVIWRDERFLEALGHGVRKLFPFVYIPGVVYVAVQNLKTVYDLTSTTDVPNTISTITQVNSTDQGLARTRFLQAQTRIHYAQRLHVGGTDLDWEAFVNFKHGTPKELSLTKGIDNGDTLKLFYSAPCAAPQASTDAIDVPDQYFDDPIVWAVHELLAAKEAVRSISTPVLQDGQRLRSDAKDWASDWLEDLKSRAMRPMPLSLRRDYTQIRRY